MRSIRPHPFGLAFALATLTGACAPASGRARAQSTNTPADGAPPAVTVIRVREGTLDRRITLPGTIRAYQETTLYAKVGGYLESVAVDRGDRVKRGQALAVLEVPEMRAELGKLEAELRAAEVDNKRVSEAAQRAPDLVTPQAVDAARAKYEVAVANLERTRTLMDYAKLTAPFAGVVTKRWVDPGAFIPAATASSSAMSSAVVTLSDFSRVRVEVAMPQAEVALVKAGLPATLTVRELPGRTFEGAVTRIAYALDDSTKTMGAEIELPNPDGVLRPGMYASVGISLERKTGALLVPAEALVTEKGKPFAFTVDANKAHKVALRLGLDDGVHVEVLEGLAANALVVVSGAQALTDGQACRAVEAR
jgi:membrane fusion protein (multidrug efflux system)